MSDQKQKLCLWNTNATITIIFWQMWCWHFTLTLTDDLDLGTTEKALPQGIHIWNIKALPLNILKLMPMLNFFFSFIDRQTNRQGKNYMLLIFWCRGIKKIWVKVWRQSNGMLYTGSDFDDKLMRSMWQSTKLLIIITFCMSQSSWMCSFQTFSQILPLNKYENMFCSIINFPYIGFHLSLHQITKKAAPDLNRCLNYSLSLNGS